MDLKRPFTALMAATLGFLHTFTAWTPPAAAATPEAASVSSARVPKTVFSFIESKEQQVRRFADDLKLTVSDNVWDFFDTLRTGEWDEIKTDYQELRAEADLNIRSTKTATDAGVPWPAILEAYSSYELFMEMDPYYAEMFAKEVMQTVPAGSLYFGGSDPGRYLVSAYSRSHVAGDPFFTLTQSALADGRYLDYLRRMYGKKIGLPTREEASQAFTDYIADAGRRLEHDLAHPGEARKVKPGEEIHKAPGGRIQVGGRVAVFNINARIAQLIFLSNPGRGFYVEESFPMDWMAPHLEPHGLILKVQRDPVPSLTPDTLSRDQEFWQPRIAGMIGTWLKEETRLSQIGDFARRVYLEKNLDGFKGDPRFTRNEPSRRLFGRLRASIASHLMWRAAQAKSAEEKVRLTRAADFALRQSMALWPGNAEAAVLHARTLVQTSREDEARELLKLCVEHNPGDDAAQRLLDTLQVKGTTSPTLR